MDLKDVKSIVDIMRRADLTEFEIEDQGFKLRIRRNGDERPVVTSSNTPPPFAVSAPEPTPQAAPPPVVFPTARNTVALPEAGVSYIKSPMVGTFYRAAAPENPSFVNVGDVVTETSVVCIIEAMKVMNDIQAEARGTILEALVENGKSVEYGQPLFKIKTA
ncbi:MAG: acetyl-CoA carboxylase biotin carboxyl carrier protein [Verrucomicrobiota bacterium]|nr:acetyl-CoA carboxylase biotin carboxyl carrier protein [Verrucomicrobiota bacterium]